MTSPVDPHEAGERSRRFLSDAAHQLRTPIAGIQACAETLLRGVAPPEQDRLLACMVRETAHAAQIVNELLTLARIDEGRPLTRGPANLVTLCRDEADRVWAVSPRVDVTLKADRRVEQVELDAAAVREIVANLLENARRHADKYVEVTLRAHGADAEVRVSDDGPGLPSGAEERAFERFVALDEDGGSGLGLAIARELAWAHGGHLTYEEGAFVLRLPGVVPATPSTAAEN